MSLKKIYNFKYSLQHEKDQAVKADQFYCNILKATEIQRFNVDSETDMEMQRQDVDLLLTLNGLTYRISEKFRDKDFGDLYVEVYSKYPKTPGWLHTGSPNANNQDGSIWVTIGISLPFWVFEENGVKVKRFNLA